MANVAYGIDLGTSNIKIFVSGDDSILVEKNMIAIEDKKVLFAYGDSAYDMYEKAPEKIQISFPLANGVIADIKNMETLIRYFISDATKNNIKPADFYVAVPRDITDVEKKAFYNLIKESGVKAKRVMVVDKPVADGLGMGIDVKNSNGVLVVNVGYDTTEISILSLGGIVLSKLIKTGGKKFDDSIRNVVRRDFGLVIGAKSAEKVKMNLRELEASGQGAVVFGRDIVTGLPVEREIPTATVDESLEEHFHMIIDNIKVILERTPPELAADIYRHGVYLTGGASQTNHLAEMIHKETNLKVNEAEAPIESVAAGLAKIIKDDNYKTVAYAIEGMGK